LSSGGPTFAATLTDRFRLIFGFRILRRCAIVSMKRGSGNSCHALVRPETKVDPGWAAELGKTKPEDTTISRAFSGRPGRSIATDYVRAALAADAPAPAPYRCSAA